MADDSELILLPWVRRGGAAAVQQPDSLTAAQSGVASATASLAVNGTPAPSVGVRLMGPGHVTGLQSGQVIRMDPTPGSRGFEPNYFPLVELDEPSLPWLFTPASAGAGERLRPWMCLVVVRVQAGVRLEPPRRGSLPVLSISAPADPRAELPDLADSWAWAHAQVTTATGAVDAAAITATLAQRPDRTLARLVCGRILAPATDYLACVVPTFELGRLAGLGLDIPPTEEAQLRPAWEVGSDLTSVELPVYHSWTFATGPHGDFQSLAMLLRARTLPAGVGERRIDVSASGVGVPVPDGTTVALGGALQPVAGQPAGWPDETVHDTVRQGLADVLNAPDAMPTDVPLLTPPRYGSVQSQRTTLDPGERERWYEQLNLEPAARAAAQFGTRLVQDHQEALVAAAWDQAAALDEVNTVIRHAQFGRLLGWSLHRRHLDRMTPEAGLQVVAPGRGRLSRTVAANAPETGFVAMFAAAAVPSPALGTAMRRLARPQGAINRRVARRAGPGRTIPADRSVIASMRPAAMMGRLVFTPTTDGIATIDRVALSLPSPRTDITWFEATAAAVRAGPRQPGFQLLPWGMALPLRPPGGSTRPPTRPPTPPPTRPPGRRPGRPGGGPSPVEPFRPVERARRRPPIDPDGPFDPFPDPVDPDPFPDPVDEPVPDPVDSAEAQMFRALAAAHLERFDPRPDHRPRSSRR